MMWKCSLCEYGEDITQFCGGCCDAFTGLVIDQTRAIKAPEEFHAIHPICERILKTQDGHDLAKFLFNPKRWGVEE